MNLKEIADSLRRRNGQWLYSSFKYESKIDLSEGGVKPIQGGLGKSADGKFYKLLKVVNSESSEPATADEIQEILKRHWSEIKGKDQLFSDLYDRFYRVLTLNIDYWKKYYNNPRVLTVSLKTIKSSSDLAKEFCMSIPNTVISGVAIKFSYQEAFEKGKNPTFDREAYKEYLMTKRNPLSEKEAERVSNVGNKEWQDAVSRAAKKGRAISAHEDIPTYRRYLIEFAREFVVRTESLTFESMIDVVVDDFYTTGMTLRKLVEELKINDGTAIGVALFAK